MESARATKRRKLDTPEKGSTGSPAPRSGKSPASANKKDAADNTTKAASKRPASGAHEDWRQAKAKAQESRGKRTGNARESTPQAVDVYDDIDGAHSGKSKLQPLSNPKPKARQLDPLRNQAASSPAKSSPLKNGGGLDFFKQFAKPREEHETMKKGKEGRVMQEAEEEGEGEEGDGDAEMEDVDQDAPATQTGKGAWKSWAYAEKSKKTFEDEIRDLEKAAKEKAEKGEDDASTDRAALRRRGRQSSTPVVAPQKADAAPKTKFMPVVTPRTAAKTMGWPKKAIEEPTISIERRKASEVDEMDVDGENELEQQLQAEAGRQPPTTTPLKQKLQKPAKKAVQNMPDVEFAADQLEMIKSVVLRQLASKRPTHLTNLDDEYAKVSSMVSQTVTAGESNSMLLIGSRGSGKTTLVNQILGEQGAKHPVEFHVVRLNGFIHTDDKIALREIWRQLGCEMDLDEEESSLKNYADTLTSLLALLSHPAEQGREQQQGQVTKSVIFILDEFELFATHPRQTLLYNLFDIAQSRKAPITVLGLTTRIDVAESLEKRVKSRFSHRYVHLSSARSLNAFQEACKATLVVRPEDLSAEEKEVLTVPSDSTRKPAGSVFDHWTAFIDALLTYEDTASHLRHIYYTTKSVPDFQSSMLLPFSTLETSKPTRAADLLDHLTPSPALATPDSKLALLSSLSTMHLALLICAARLTAIHGQDIVPFAQAYEEYKAIASKAKIQASASGALASARIFGKDVARGVWGDLVGMGLVMEDGVRGGRVDVGLEEVGACAGVEGVELGGWGRWCREI